MPDPHRMISWRDYGSRMIGAGGAARADFVRARYRGMGAGPLLNLGPQNVAPAGGSFAGETYTPGPAIVPHTLTLHLGPAPRPAPAITPHILTLHLATATAAVPALTVAVPPPPVPVSFTPVAAPAPSPLLAQAGGLACASCTGKAVAAGAGGFAAGSLLMYLVGLSTREHKNKRRKNRRR